VTAVSSECPDQEADSRERENDADDVALLGVKGVTTLQADCGDDARDDE